jgi:hypothetical protein
MQKIKELSSSLRKERENSFYGDDDMIPTQVFTQEQALKVVNDCKWLMKLINDSFKV